MRQTMFYGVSYEFGLTESPKIQARYPATRLATLVFAITLEPLNRFSKLEHQKVSHKILHSDFQCRVNNSILNVCYRPSDTISHFSPKSRDLYFPVIKNQKFYISRILIKFYVGLAGSPGCMPVLNRIYR